MDAGATAGAAAIFGGFGYITLKAIIEAFRSWKQKRAEKKLLR